MAEGSPVEKLGIVCTFIVGFQILKFLFGSFYRNFLAVKLGINGVDVKKSGQWAVVTGATDGIGKAYAELLAKKGLNIVLISRTQTKLEDVAKRIELTHKVSTKIIPADFTETEKIYHEIDKQLTGLDIGVLINNVGMSVPYPDYFLDVKNEDLYKNIINVNVYSVTNMCKIVMPGMVDRRRGIVVNISSTSAEIPAPLLSVYAATKSYVRKFSQDLATEYAQHNITVQSLLPGFVATNMSKIRNSTWMAPCPEKFVGSALATVGVHRETTGYFPHTLLVGFLNCLKAISPRLSEWLVMRTLSNIRAKVLRKSRE